MRTLTDIMTALLKTVKLVAHPVGSIYISTVETSPEELFGGTWEQVQDTFLWCAGTNHPAGSTGGEETHTLTVEEMPSHVHPSSSYACGLFSGWGDLSDNGWVTASTDKATGGRWITDATGGGAAHNNMPPYLAVYAWKRVA